MYGTCAHSCLLLGVCMQALYEASKRAKAGAGAKGHAAAGPPERLDKRTLMQEAFTERMREQQVGAGAFAVKLPGALPFWSTCAARGGPGSWGLTGAAAACLPQPSCWP